MMVIQSIAVCAPEGYRAGVPERLLAPTDRAVEILGPRLVGRATPLTLVAAAAVAALARRGHPWEPDEPFVHGTMTGERDVCRHVHREALAGRVSPLEFQHSVQNTSAAYLSFGTGCRMASTTLLAGRQSGVDAIREAGMMAVDRGGRVLALVTDLLPALNGVTAGAIACQVVPGGRDPAVFPERDALASIVETCPELATAFEATLRALLLNAETAIECRYLPKEKSYVE